MKLLERFLRYAAIDTTSDPTSDEVPSTTGQLVLLRMLADELRAMGAAEVELHDAGYLTAAIPASPGCEGEPVIGFLAHVDTSPDAPGANVRPMLHERNGEVTITSDGTTLLGADDKAGVAEIVTAAEYLFEHPEVRHGRVRIAFTTDEETGRGTDGFDVRAFGADFAYTVDGGAEGELEYENFNAAGALITIRGHAIHPGEAKGRMVNALRVALEFDSALPPSERPETTEGREGFYHLIRIDGTVARAEAEYIIRDHDHARFEARKAALEALAARLDEKYGGGVLRGEGACSVFGGEGRVVEIALVDQYRNMREVIERRPEIVDRAKRAMLAAGVTPRVIPIRGGTDGARLSFAGLPCPNLFTGGKNFHSLQESISLQSMQRAVQTIIEIVKS